MKYCDKNKNLRKLQLKELDILKYFDSFCSKNKLKYFLFSGTLLGAVRHKGFIPWDDDVDITMSGSEYLKLAELFEKDKDDKYFFQSLETEKSYYLLWNKIRLNNTIFVEKGWEENDTHQGIFIDIFPLLEYPDNEKDKKIIARKIKISRLLIENNLKNNNYYKSYGKSGKILSKMFKLIPKFIRNKIAINNIKYLCNYKSNSGYYFVTDTGMDMKYKKEYFDKMVKLPFEDYEFLCPKDYHEVLEITYGDYMTLPKEEERRGHGESYLCFDTKDDLDEIKR